MEDLAKAKEGIAQAQRLAPDDVETLVAQGIFHTYVDLDYDRALAYLRGSLRWAEAEGRPREVMFTLIRLSSLHVRRGSGKRALMLAKRAADIKLPPDEG